MFDKQYDKKQGGRGDTVWWCWGGGGNGGSMGAFPPPPPNSFLACKWRAPPLVCLTPIFSLPQIEVLPPGLPLQIQNPGAATGGIYAKFTNPAQTVFSQNYALNYTCMLDNEAHFTVQPIKLAYSEICIWWMSFYYPKFLCHGAPDGRRIYRNF